MRTAASERRMRVKIRLNGKSRELEEPMTVSDLIAAEGYRPELIAVEINLAIIPKKDYAATMLSEGDVVEIVSFMGGG
jgi:sulfur carrier protein